MGEKPTIGAGAILRDLRAGMSDSELMHKYRLSAKGLQSLFQKMIAKGLVTADDLEHRPLSTGAGATGNQVQDTDRKGTVISPGEAVRDIRSGMHDFDLMSKYNLSAKGLESLFGQLVKSGLLQQTELDRRMPAFEETVELAPKGKLLTFGNNAPASAGDEEELDLSWECPVCGIYQTHEYTKCPECGALVALLKRKRTSD